MLLAAAAVEISAAVEGAEQVPAALLRDLVIVTVRLTGCSWLETDVASGAAVIALQASRQPPPLPELDRILARALADRFGAARLPVVA